MVAGRVQDHQVLDPVAVHIQGPDQPGTLGGVGHRSGSESVPGRGLVDEHQLVIAEQDDVVPAVLIDVADGECAGPLHALARVDLLEAAEPPLPLVEEDLDLGRRPVEHQVGLAVAVEVARVDADYFLVHGDVDFPHPLVVVEVVDVLAERAVRLVVIRLLGAQEQVDARPGIVADDDVVDLVAVQVPEHQVADAVLELVDLQRPEAEVIGEPIALLQALGDRPPGRRTAGNEEQHEHPEKWSAAAYPLLEFLTGHVAILIGNPERQTNSVRTEPATDKRRRRNIFLLDRPQFQGIRARVAQ